MMNESLWRTRIGPIISTLGGLLMLIGFCLPLFVTSPPINSDFSNPYPPLVNGWYVIGLLHDYFPWSYLALVYVAPEVALVLGFAVATLSTSLLVLSRRASPLVVRMRLYTAFASIAVLGWLWTASLFLNWADSPDGAAASPMTSLGPAFWQLLLPGTVLSAIGAGSGSLGALPGAFIGIIIGFFPGLIPVAGPLLYVSVSILGSILGGQLFLKGQAQLQRELPASVQSSPIPKNP